MAIAQGCRAAVWMLVAGLAAAAGGPVLAADVEITTDSGAIDLDAESGATVHIATGVTVSGEITATTQAWTLTNDGAVQLPGFANAIAFSAGGAIHNAAGSTISAGYSAIILGNAGTGAGIVENAGTITGGAFGDAVQLYGGGTVTNLAGAEINSTSSSNAVSLSGGTSRSVFNYGTISNTGGTWATGVLIQGAAGSITNATGGVIFGTYNGVYASGTAPLTLVNAGSITSANGPAVEARGGGTFTNSGTISSGNDGMFVAGAATVTNSGTLASTGSGRAIAFSGGEEHTLILDTGSVLTGNAQGGTGTDNLVLRGTGTESIGKFLSFKTLTMQGVDWTLAGIGTFATTASIDSGRLAVGGTLTTGTLSILSGGVLGGSGNVAAAVVNAGTIAPGDSIGTLTVHSVLFSPNAMLEIEIDPLTSDRLVVAGTATISSDAMVKVLPVAGIYSDGFEYLILDASTGERVGEFGGVVENSAFLDFTLDHVKDPNQVWLTVLNVAAFPDVAETPNQIATAQALEALGPGNLLFDAILVLDADQARNAFDLASGEVHATLVGALVNDSRFIREAVLDRLRRRFDAAFQPAALGYAAEPDDAKAFAAGPAATAWANGFGSWGAFAGDGNAAAFDRRLGGAVGGVDWTMAEGWRFGAAGGLQSAWIDVPDRASSAGIHTAHVAAYGGLTGDTFAVRFGGAYAWHQVATVRDVAFPGFSDRLTASYGARTAQVFGEAGIPMEIGGVAIEPFAGLVHVHVATDAFTETGGPAALSAPAGSASVTYSTIGGRLASAIGNGRTQLHAMAAWQHAFGSLTPMTMPAFAGGNPFAIAGAPMVRDALRLEMGVDHTFRMGATASLLYSGMIASGARDHGVKAKLAVSF